MPSSAESGPARADLSNWRNAPFSRWAFSHVRDILPVATIAAGGGTPWPLPAHPRALDGFRVATGDGGTLTFPDFLAATATDGLVVLADGEILAEHYGGETSAETPHIVMSASKSVTGLLAGILHETADLEIDVPVTAYIPEVAGGPYRGATLRHLLDMRVNVLFEAEQQRAYDLATGWTAPGTGEPASSLHAFFTALRAPLRPHGGSFRYVSANTDLLGWAIERATGRSYASLASEFLWQPLGAEADAAITTDPAGAPRTTGGLCVTVRDLARVGQLVACGGRREQTEIVPAPWIDDMLSNGDREAWRTGEFGSSFGGLPMSYRSNWYVVHGATPSLFAMGVFGQFLYVDPTRRFVVAKVSSQAEAVDQAAIALTLAAVPELRRCLIGH